jgi:hypothetical protein
MNKKQKELLIKELNKLALKSILHQRKTGEKFAKHIKENCIVIWK